jgi:MFS family permease
LPLHRRAFTADDRAERRADMVDETEKQRWERNFGDLLQELRVAQTGVQILFAFLLALPFTAPFDKVTAGQRVMYLVALVTAAFATGAIISPVAFDRVLFRRGRKPEMVRFAHRMSSVGLAYMLVSMVTSVLLVADFLLPRPIALALTGVATLWFLSLWGALPFARRGWGDSDPGEARSAGQAADRVRASTGR